MPTTTTQATSPEPLVTPPRTTARPTPRRPPSPTRWGAGGPEPPAGALTVTVAGPADEADARWLLAQQGHWLADVLDMPVSALQPGSDAEYRDPLGYYRPPSGALLVARLDGAPIGLVGVRALGGGDAELKRMFVLPAGRGAGAGRALLGRAIEVARGVGHRRLLLETLPGPMDHAIALYREAGFTDRPVYSLDLGGAIGLELDLGQR